MKKLIFILFIAAIIQSCKKDTFVDSIETPDGLIQWNIAKVEGPTFTTLNQAIALEVTYPTSSGCDIVSEFGTTNIDNFIYIKAFGKTLNDSPCTQAAVPKKIDFTYTPTIKGDIIFRFLKKDNSYIEHRIRVD